MIGVKTAPNMKEIPEWSWPVGWQLIWRGRLDSDATVCEFPCAMCTKKNVIAWPQSMDFMFKVKTMNMMKVPNVHHVHKLLWSVGYQHWGADRQTAGQTDIEIQTPLAMTMPFYPMSMKVNIYNFLMVWNIHWYIYFIIQITKCINSTSFIIVNKNHQWKRSQIYITI